MIEVTNLSKQFGGVTAVDNVSFNIPNRGIYSVIGPNGAGKTTLFNLVTGMYTPSSGSVRLGEADITGASPEQLAKLGFSRTFQNLQICQNMSALENVMTGAHLKLSHSFLMAALRFPRLVRAEDACRHRCSELMRFVGLERYIASPADSMSYGALKRLEIARALASEPKVLFLDEPAAGLNDTETKEVAELIQKIADAGTTVVLVEHDMAMVMRISNRVLVLEYGRRLAEGTPREVQEDPRVIAAYLGATA